MGTPLVQQLDAVPGVAENVATRMRQLLATRPGVDTVLLDFLASKEGTTFLAAYRNWREGSKERAVADGNNGGTASQAHAGATEGRTSGRQKLSAEQRRSGAHYFAAVAPPDRPSKTKSTLTGAKSVATVSGTPTRGKNVCGAPQAKPCDNGGSTEATRQFGALKSFNLGTGYGFLHCSDLRQDIYLRKEDLPDGHIPEIGRQATFVRSWDARGRAQARDVKWLPAPLSTKSLEEEASPSQSCSKRYTGCLKSMGDEYGFIDSEEARKEFGRDVFLAKGQLPAAQWDASLVVEFAIALNSKGMPQARNVHFVDQGSTSGCLDIESSDRSDALSDDEESRIPCVSTW